MSIRFASDTLLVLSRNHNERRSLRYFITAQAPVASFGTIVLTKRRRRLAKSDHQLGCSGASL